MLTCYHLCNLLNVSNPTVEYYPLATRLVTDMEKLMHFDIISDYMKEPSKSAEEYIIDSFTKALNMKGIYKLTRQPFGFYILCRDGICFVNLSKMPVTCECHVVKKFNLDITEEQLQIIVQNKSVELQEFVSQLSKQYATYADIITTGAEMKVIEAFSKITNLPNVVQLSVKPFGFYVTCKDKSKPYQAKMYCVRVSKKGVNCVASKWI